MKYDVIVLGAGSAGLNVAVAMTNIGLKVLMVEKHLIGGDCLNYGCVPSKALISLSHHAHEAQKATKLGLKVSGSVNLKTVAETVKKRQDVIRVHENPEHFRKMGMDVEIGSPRFTSENSILINDKHAEAKKIIIATGSRPLIPDIPGLDKTDYLTNETIFENKKLPKNLLIIGEGPIGIEMAQAYQRLGSQVTVVGHASLPLSKEEEEVSQIMKNALEEEGMNLLLGTHPVAFKGKNTLTLQKWDAKNQKPTGKKTDIKFDQVLVATGRKINYETLDVEKAGIEMERGRFILDKYLRTTNKNVFVCGDAAGKFLFTHWAETEAWYVINNMISPLKKSPNPDIIAWVTFTDPEVATFGLPLEKVQKLKHKVISFELNDVDRAISEGLTHGKLKLYVHKNKIVRGTIVGKGAGEIAGELITAMTHKLPASKIINRIYPYPTMGRIIKSAFLNDVKGRLTPTVAKLLRFLFRIKR